jgi:hypothetical protein
MVGDVMVGARLQLDSAFGYGPIVGVRISGFGNISFAALSAAAVLLAGLVAHRVGGRTGIEFAIAILVVALVFDTAPFWGADAGGVLSMVPAYGVTVALLLGKVVRAKPRTILLCVGAALLGLAIAAAIDLSRAEADRTHLGRFIEQVRDDGFSTITTTLAHKLDQTVNTITGFWGLMLLVVPPFLLFLKFASDRLTMLVQRIPELRAALIGFTILAVLGCVLNDSGINIPGMMLGLLNAMLIALILRADAEKPNAKGKPRRAVGKASATR